METVGIRIRDARRSRYLSLTALAGETCTKAHISATELGKVHPSPRVQHIVTSFRSSPPLNWAFVTRVRRVFVAHRNAPAID